MQAPPSCDLADGLTAVSLLVRCCSRVPELAAAHMQQQQQGSGAGQQQQVQQQQAAASSMLLDDVLASHLPTSRVPRLHAVLLSTVSGGADVGMMAPAPAAAAAAAMSAEAVGAARARVLGFLSQVLGGDDVAAQYLLLQLLGRCGAWVCWSVDVCVGGGTSISEVCVGYV